MHTYNYLIQETDLDTFGHVNNASYLRIFEQARWDWIANRGFGLDVVKEKQIGPTILEINIKYKRELKHREPIRIESICAEHNGKISKVRQKMINAKNEVASEIELTIGLFDMQRRRLISATPEWARAIGIEDV
jgi:thioesterase III